MSNHPTNKQPQKEDTHISQVLAGYIAYWPLFLLTPLLFLGLAFLYNRYRIPLFEANAKIIIKDEKKGSQVSKEMEELDIISTKKISENETEVLQSRNIADNVVRKLRLYAPLKQEGKLRALSAYTLSPVSVEFELPDQIKSPEKSAEKIYFQYDKAANTVRITGKQIDCPLNEWTNTPYGKMRFTPNKRHIPSVNGKPFYFELYAVRDITNGLLGNLKVATSSKQSSIINLTYKDPVPEKAEDILNEIIFFYNEAALLEKNTMVKNTLATLQERLQSVKYDLDSIERKIQVYKAGRGAVELNQQGNLYLQSVAATDSKTGEVRVQMSVLDQIERSVAGNSSGTTVLPSSVGLNDAALSNMVAELNKAQLEKESLKKTVGENNPVMQALDDQISKLRPGIIENIRTQKKNLNISLNNLSSATGRYNSMLNYIPEKEKELLEISRDQQIKTAIYSFLLQKREESELSYASIISDSKVINKAQAGSTPSGLGSSILYGMALLLGLTFPILFINLKEALNGKIIYRKEIEKLTAIPVISEVSHNKDKNKPLIEINKRSLEAEEFRKLRIALLYVGIDALHKKRILVTSSIPAEGKSFIAANLAISLATTGKKVVLVDLDIHNPSMGKLFDKESHQGVSDYLIDTADMNDIVTSTDTRNLSFIPAGNNQENPSELLLNGKIEELVHRLEKDYDVVIMDSAPTVFITDAFYLTNLADATLYVVRHNHTPKQVIKRLDESLQVNPLNNPAIVFNGVKMRGFLKTGYGYGYTYTYTKYGYGNTTYGAKKDGRPGSIKKI
jgi:tyrosine-protein kinase Etk/Wzc